VAKNPTCCGNSIPDQGFGKILNTSKSLLTVNHRKQNHWCNSPTAKLEDVKLLPWKIEPSTLSREYHTQLPQLDLFGSRLDHICWIQ
jgi:hypothetical protein